jgi:hypothetical protein
MSTTTLKIRSAEPGNRAKRDCPGELILGTPLAAAHTGLLSEPVVENCWSLTHVATGQALVPGLESAQLAAEIGVALWEQADDAAREALAGRRADRIVSTMPRHLIEWMRACRSAQRLLICTGVDVTGRRQYEPAEPDDLDQITDAVARDDGTGICESCGHEQAGCEPDAQHYRCESCGKFAVFGAEETLFRRIG